MFFVLKIRHLQQQFSERWLSSIATFQNHIFAIRIYITNLFPVKAIFEKSQSSTLAVTEHLKYKPSMLFNNQCSLLKGQQYYSNSRLRLYEKYIKIKVTRYAYLEKNKLNSSNQIKLIHEKLWFSRCRLSNFIRNFIQHVD